MKKTLLLLSMMATMLTACSDDDSDNQTNDPVISPTTEIKGLYIMCEGNWGSNNAAVDFIDFSSSQYTQNIFEKSNPDIVMGLGDTSSDMQAYGNQLWVVVNGSNKVEVLDIETCKRIAKIDVTNCRYVTFNDDYAYISSYVGPLAADYVQLGTVFKIDTRNFNKVDSVVVSYQPEEMAIIGNMLYVACSGGYRYPTYDRVISAIDLTSFKKVSDIDTEVNLHRMRKDSNNQLWVTSRGNYADKGPSLICLKKDASGNLTVSNKKDIAVSDMCIVGDSLYYFGVEWDNATMSNKVSYGIINTKTHEQVPTTIFNNESFKQIEVPYGIIVTPDKRELFITDAKNYVSSGKLYHFSADGSCKWNMWTSDIPSKMVFYSK